MLIKAKVKMARKGKIWSIRNWPPNYLKANLTSWRLSLHSWKA
jgi:hypothetical protein